MTSIGLVILFHAMCAYTAHVPWLYMQVNDQTTAMHIYMANNWIVMCGFFLILKIAMFLRLFNREYRWLKPLYGLNYGIYLMHMVFVILQQARITRIKLIKHSRISPACS